MIPELFSRGKPVFSFEFFQPKSPTEMSRFKTTVRDLKALAPDFVTVTYGAGGAAGERIKTVETAGLIKREIGLETAAHLTCLTHTRPEILEVIDRIAAHGIENIVALRGDRPAGSEVPAHDFEYAVDLVRIIRARKGFRIGVAGYPEKHPEAVSRQTDLIHLKEKVAAGADWVITQLFFKNADYFDFVRRARAVGISVPIVPGIMPVTSFSQIQRFTTLCGASLPEPMVAELGPIASDPDAVSRYGIEYATQQCRGLLDGGAPGIHFYTLNRSHATATILSRLRAG